MTQTVEVESADSQKAVAEMQVKNNALQEQLSAQRQLLRELETQLHESQRTCAQLRTQVSSPAVERQLVRLPSESQTPKNLSEAPEVLHDPTCRSQLFLLVFLFAVTSSSTNVKEETS